LAVARTCWIGSLLIPEALRAASNNRIQEIVFGISPDPGEPRHEVRQVDLDGVPDQAEVDLEVAVGDSIPHALHVRPGNLRMPLSEARMLLEKPCRGFADHHELQDHGTLGPRVGSEGFFGHPAGEREGSLGGLLHVQQVVLKARRGHTDFASETTRSRNLP